MLNQSCVIQFRSPDKSVKLKVNFLISQPKHMLWVLKRTVSMIQFFQQPKQMFYLMGKKIITASGIKICLSRLCLLRL